MSSPQLEHGLRAAVLQEEGGTSTGRLYEVSATCMLSRSAYTARMASDRHCHPPCEQVAEDLEPVEAIVQYGRSGLPFQRLAYCQVRAAEPCCLGALWLRTLRGRLARFADQVLHCLGCGQSLPATF